MTRLPTPPPRGLVSPGWTLLELLVALGLLGLVFGLVLAWQTSTLRLSAQAGAQALEVQALNDLTGYLGDRARAAVRVRVAASGTRLNGRPCTLTSPCLLLVLPEEASPGTFRYLLYAYRLDPRTLVSSLDRREDDWADRHVRALREYRSTAPGTPGSSSPANCVATPVTFASSCPELSGLDLLSTLSRFQPYLVTDDLAPESADGQPLVPFAFDPVSRTLTLRFQLWQRVSGRDLRVPNHAPLTLEVQPRNLP